MDQKNVLIAVLISLAILMGWQILFEHPKLERERQQQAAEQAAPQTPGARPAAPGVPPGPVAAGTPAAPPGSRKTAIEASPRIKIITPRVTGSIALRGGDIDDVTLTDYKQTVDKDSPPITLFSPFGSEHPYFARFGWLAQEQGIEVPGPETVWQADRPELSPGRPVTLSWKSPQNLVFTQKIAIDANYMFTVDQSVANQGDRPVTMFTFGQIQRIGKPRIEGFFILHEGMIGWLKGRLEEIEYNGLDKPFEADSANAWLGITDKYWLAALVPDQNEQIHGRFSHTAPNKIDEYSVDYRGSASSIAPGGNARVTGRVFAGAKEVWLLDAYEKELGLTRFDKAVDFGWFYFLTKPIFYVLDYFGKHLGNFGLGILLLTVIIKALFFPLANKSYRAMSRLKVLQPKMMEIRERYKDDRLKQNEAMMKLYKESNANPMSGCLPMIIQIPVFFALYKVLFVTIEMRHAPFYGWIRDLSAPDPTSIFNLFGLLPWSPPEVMLLGATVGAWALIMGCTMYLQQLLNPQPADPIQARMFMLLPVIFTFVLASFPAGLVIYWAWNNILSVGQQWLIMRQAGQKPAPSVPAAKSKKS